MSKSLNTFYLIIGAGIVGLSVAHCLSKITEEKIIIIDKEKYLGAHASGRNSGVLHAGFYYTPGTLKAKLTKEGNQRLNEYCKDNNKQHTLMWKKIDKHSKFIHSFMAVIGFIGFCMGVVYKWIRLKMGI